MSITIDGTQVRAGASDAQTVATPVSAGARDAGRAQMSAPADRSHAAAIHVAASNAASEQFFAEHADVVARACHAMSVRFRRGGRLLAYGADAQRSDVAHVVVEFLHPVIVGKRALPAIALPDGELLATLARRDDILVLLCAGVPGPVESDLLVRAGRVGMLVLALTGGRDSADGSTLDADFHFAAPSNDPLVVQETHEILYHVLWELAHVFLEDRSVTE